MESNSWYKLILDSIRDMILVKGPDSKLLWANKSFRDYYGMTEEDLKNIVDGPQSSPDDTLQYVRDDKFVFDSQSDLNIPSEPVTDSRGATRYFHTIKSPIFQDGEMIQSVGVSRALEDGEIHQQELSELDAKVFTAPLRSIIDTIPVQALLLDHNLRVVKENKLWIQAFGEVRSMNESFDYNYPFLNSLSEAIGSSQASNSAVEKTLGIDQADQSRFFSFKITPWNYPNGGVGGVILIATDITEIKERELEISRYASELEKKEKELEAANRKYQALLTRQTLALQASNVGVWDWDLASNHLVWDEQMYFLYGIREEDFEGAYPAWEKGLHPGDRERSVSEVQQAVAGESKFDTEFRVVWPSGEVKSIRALADVVKDTDGVPVKMVGVNWDITDVKNHEKELEQMNTKLSSLNEELKQFAYRTSHDLKAPLISTQRLINFVIQDIQNGKYEEAISNSGKISKLMIKLSALIEDILLLVKADVDLDEKENVNMQLILEEIGEKLSLLADENECALSHEISTQGPLFLQKIRITQIIENLISNGIKYRSKDKDSSYVKTTIRQNEMDLVVTVEDNGVGIPKHQQSEVFKMFKRFHPDLSFGSGLGMSIIKKHVDNLGGEISFSSTDSGTRFEIRLPNAFKEPQ